MVCSTWIDSGGPSAAMCWATIYMDGQSVGFIQVDPYNNATTTPLHHGKNGQGYYTVTFP